MRLATLLVPLVASLNLAWGKIFEKCELASDLVTRYNISTEEVKSLVCIAEYESTFNSAAINHFNWDGSKDFGLFQLNNNFWCGNEFGQNVCKTSCESFLDDDLTDDLRCVQIIVKDTKRWMNVKNGYVAWVAYVNRCQNRNLDEYMAECASTPTTTTVDTSKSPAVTTVKPDLTTTTIRTLRVPPKAQVPIRTSQNKPDQVRGPQIPLSKPIPVRESKPQAETLIPIRISQHKPDQVRGPQIPILWPIPVRESKPQTDIQTPVESEDVLKPSKVPLKTIESSQFINPISVKVVEELLHILTGAISQFDLKPVHMSTQTSHKNDKDAQLPSNEFAHPEIESLAGSDGESNFTNLSPELLGQEDVVGDTKLSNLLNNVVFGGFGNAISNNLNLNTFPSKGLTRFYTKKPAGIPIVNHYPKNPLRFSPILKQLQSPYLGDYNPVQLISSPETSPQIFIAGYGIYNPYQTFPHNRNVFFRQTPNHGSFLYPGTSYSPATPYLSLRNDRY